VVQFLQRAYGALGRVWTRDGRASAIIYCDQNRGFMDLCHLCHIFVILIGGRVTISQVVALVDVVTREIEVTFPILKQYYTAEPPTASIPASSSIQRPSQIADSDRSSLFYRKPWVFGSQSTANTGYRRDVKEAFMVRRWPLHRPAMEALQCAKEWLHRSTSVDA